MNKNEWIRQGSYLPVLTYLLTYLLTYIHTYILIGWACWIGSLMCFDTFMRTTEIPSRQRLWSSTTDNLSVPAVWLSILLDVALFLPLVHVYGTIYLLTLPPHWLCLHLSNDYSKMRLFHFSYTGLAFYLFLPSVVLEVCLLLRPR